MHTLEPIIRQHPFFKGLPQHAIDLIVGCAGNIVFQPDHRVYREGEPANRFYVIREGCIALELYVPGRGPIVIETLGAGDVLGWSWLIPPYRLRYSARAVELTRAIGLDATCIRNKCEADHDLGYELLKRVAGVIVERLQASRLQLADVYGPTPSGGE